MTRNHLTLIGILYLAFTSASFCTLSTTEEEAEYMDRKLQIKRQKESITSNKFLDNDVDTLSNLIKTTKFESTAKGAYEDLSNINSTHAIIAQINILILGLKGKLPVAIRHSSEYLFQLIDIARHTASTLAAWHLHQLKISLDGSTPSESEHTIGSLFLLKPVL
ncbi:hypothetical protein IM40_02215 [Candidatus Paracaedimonas acanthamoebae]|nr:hypothetical protein IM40_02215 [Candidatus Paracaedimonas acanthamoebae]